MFSLEQDAVCKGYLRVQRCVLALCSITCVIGVCVCVCVCECVWGVLFAVTPVNSEDILLDFPMLLSLSLSLSRSRSVSLLSLSPSLSLSLSLSLSCAPPALALFLSPRYEPPRNVWLSPD